MQRTWLSVLPKSGVVDGANSQVSTKAFTQCSKCRCRSTHTRRLLTTHTLKKASFDRASFTIVFVLGSRHSSIQFESSAPFDVVSVPHRCDAISTEASFLRILHNTRENVAEDPRNILCLPRDMRLRRNLLSQRKSFHTLIDEDQ